VYDPRRLAMAMGDLLTIPPPVDVRHIPVSKATVAERLAHLRAPLRKGAFTFDDPVHQADRTTAPVTPFALPEMYKQGEATRPQEEPFGEITIDPVVAASARPAPLPVAARGAA